MVAWHQDGAFYDSDVRTMNIWIALTPCGVARTSGRCGHNTRKLWLFTLAP